MKKVLLGLLLGLILGIGGYYVYNEFIKEEEVKEIIKKEPCLEEKDYNQYIKSGLNISNINLETGLVKKIDLPKIIIDNENAKNLNKKILNDYNDSIDKLKNNDADLEFKIDYDYSILDNILFIKINYVGKLTNGGINYEFKGYYYDLDNNKELITEEIANKYDITIDKINESLKDYNKTVNDFSNPLFPSEKNIKIILVGNIETPIIEALIK